MTVAHSHPDTGAGIVSAETSGLEDRDGHSAALVPPGRPFWQERPCPPWCEMAIPHSDTDMRGDRACLSVTSFITLSLEDAEIIPIPAIGGHPAAVEVSTPFLSAGLIQHYREREPQIVLTHNGHLDIPLTLAEAAELAETLADLVRQARDGAR